MFLAGKYLIKIFDNAYRGYILKLLHTCALLYFYNCLFIFVFTRALFLVRWACLCLPILMFWVFSVTYETMYENFRFIPHSTLSTLDIRFASADMLTSKLWYSSVVAHTVSLKESQTGFKPDKLAANCNCTAKWVSETKPNTDYYCCTLPSLVFTFLEFWRLWNSMVIYTMSANINFYRYYWYWRSPKWSNYYFLCFKRKHLL